MTKHILTITMPLALALCALPITSDARQTSLIGSLSLAQDYDSNVHRDPSGEVDQWRSTLSPTLRLQSTDASDSFTFGYSPGIVYNYRTDDVSFDHALSMLATKALTQYWNFRLSDAFVKSDDPTTRATEDPETAQTPLSANRDRGRYWTNTLALNTDYTYSEGSNVRAGYSHVTLDNATVGADYNRDIYSAGISNRHSAEWRWRLNYQFSDTNFDDREDIRSHIPSIQLDYTRTPQQAIFGRYSLGHTDYMGSSADYDTHAGVLGMALAIDSQTSLNGYGGYSLVKRDNNRDTDAFTYGLGYSHQEQLSSIAINGAGGLEDQHYSGVDNAGLTRFWSANGTFSYQFMEFLRGNLAAGVRFDEFLERAQNPNELSLDASLGLTYSFLRWYSLSPTYSFRQLNADDATNDYDDHRILMTLSASKELWRW